MQHSTGKPTKAEAKRIEDMMRLGCAACASLDLFCPADECHHLISGNKRLGHNYTIPLCRGHHRGLWRWGQQDCIPAQKLVSISSGGHRWNAAYPTEKELWERVQIRLHLPLDWPQSKLLPRRLEIVT